ncbi:MAG TPA: hypothetical protein PLE61_05025 [Vicinamibacterales bacterium]|nr:hypothetical protein [Vicinamibacterales bacterium]HOG28076.1 hypothetical protein [Vicinamibacterales bacterium]HPW20160.1 hypothetical protein [Vicinamibacterales bacterium]
MRSGRFFAVAVLAGLAVRLAALPLPGTSDVTAFKVWAHAAATGPVAEMYGVGGTPPERRVHEYDHWEATVDYPPVALYALSAAGRLYGWARPGFANTPLLAACIKALPLACEGAMTLVLWAAVRRVQPHRADRARFAALAFWLNPASILATPVLGYLDALFALPALGALVAAASGAAGLSGALMAAAILTKPQAVLFAPAVALALAVSPSGGASRPRARSLSLAAGAAILSAAAILAPIAAAGAWPNFVQAMRSLGRHDMLSGQAANLWWIVTYIMRAAYAAAEMGVAGAFLSPVRRPLAITRLAELGYPDPRLAATALTVAAVAWALWTGRKVRDLPRFSLLGAWSVYAYFVLSVQVHENHFFMILPPLALAAALLPRWRAPLWVLSGMFALNLNLFYGFGDGIGFAVPRTATRIDATVLLSAANLAAFAWVARLLRDTLRDAPASGATADREDSRRRPRALFP